MVFATIALDPGRTPHGSNVYADFGLQEDLALVDSIIPVGTVAGGGSVWNAVVIVLIAQLADSNPVGAQGGADRKQCKDSWFLDAFTAR